MNPLEALGLALGAGFSSGLNLYATVATLGLLQRFGVIHLPDSLEVVGHPIVLGIAVALYLVEFFADKVPYLDTIWDAAHTFVRPPAAAIIAYGAAGGISPHWRRRQHCSRTRQQLGSQLRRRPPRRLAHLVHLHPSRRRHRHCRRPSDP